MAAPLPIVKSTDTKGIIQKPAANADYKKALVAIAPWLAPEDLSAQARLYGLSVKNPRVNPEAMSGGVRNFYLSQSRASQALTKLNKSGVKGPGATFLQNALGLLKKYGAQGANQGMSRADYSMLANELQQLIAGSKNQDNIGLYSALAQQFINPTLSMAGNVMTSHKAGGKTFYGAPSSKLWT